MYPPQVISHIAYRLLTLPALQEMLDVLKDRHALEIVQEILSPVRWPKQLTIMTAECGVVNSWYRRELLKPVVRRMVSAMT
jgi:hypothetical protein